MTGEGGEVVALSSLHRISVTVSTTCCLRADGVDHCHIPPPHTTHINSAIGYTPTAIGYPPAAIVGRIGHSEFFLFLLWHPLGRGDRRGRGVVALSSLHRISVTVSTTCCLRADGVDHCHIPPPHTTHINSAIGYTPTAIGYPPAAIVGRIGHSEFFLFLLWHPLGRGDRRGRGVVALSSLHRISVTVSTTCCLRADGVDHCHIPPPHTTHINSAIGYTPTAIGYPPAAIVGRIGHSEFFLFLLWHPLGRGDRRGRGVVALSSLHRISVTVSTTCCLRADGDPESTMNIH